MSLSKNQILEKWYRENVVQDIVRHYSGIDREEVVAMIYAYLCEKDEELIQHLYESGEYRFYISRMVSNQIISNDSPYYRQNRIGEDITPYTNRRMDSRESIINKLDIMMSEEDRMIIGIIVNSDYLGVKKTLPNAALREYFNCSSYSVYTKMEKFRKRAKKCLERN